MAKCNHKPGAKFDFTKAGSQRYTCTICGRPFVPDFEKRKPGPKPKLGRKRSQAEIQRAYRLREKRQKSEN